MELIKPQFGLIFWMALSFLILMFILGKFAFPIIMKSLKEREDSITNALSAAEKAKKEMAALQADNEKLLVQARAERDLMLKEARDTKDAIVSEAKNKAQELSNDEKQKTLMDNLMKDISLN